MGRFDWDMDELLNFDYGKPVPDGRTAAESQQANSAGQQHNSSVGQSHADYYTNKQSLERNQKDDAQLYAEIRRKEQEKAIKEAQLREYMASTRRAEEKARQEAVEKAQREAQLRAQQEAKAQAEKKEGYRIQMENDLRAQRDARAQQFALRQQEEIDLRARKMAEARAEAEAHRIEEHEKQLQAAMQKQQMGLHKDGYSNQRAAYERYRAETRNQHATKEERKFVNSQIREDQKALKQEKRNEKKSEKAARGNSKRNNSDYKINDVGKGGSKKSNSKIAKNSVGAKILSVLYLIAMVTFSVAMLIMNVLPLKYLLLMYVILVLLSAIIVTQLRGSRIKKWARGIAIFMALVMTLVYGVGTAYALGTLSFLGNTSVKNEDSVGKITEDPFNVIMTGIDVNGTIDEQGRSDVNMIVTVNPATSTILMTSVPRDYEVRLPDKGYATDKLTHTGFYGVETTIQAEEDLFGIESNYYVKVNFSTVKNFINAIGGVDVYSEYTFVPVKMKSWTVQEGVNHMTGEQALAFARERKAFATGDNQRIKNQQAVFEALIKKATSSKTMAISYGKILNQLEDYFEMSFSSSEIRNLMKFQIAKSPEWKIYKNTVSGPGASKATYTGGSQKLYVMEQDPTSVANAKVLINAVLEGKQLQEDENGIVTVVSGE